MRSINVLITGVGGQGVVLASDILGDVAISCGYDVKKTDTLGMAQRGGSVITHMRIGATVDSQMIGAREADLLLGFEKLEAARWSAYLKPEATVIVSDQCMPPLSVSLGRDVYPNDDKIMCILSHSGAKVTFVEGQRMAAELGNIKVLNVLMLGVVSVLMPFDKDSWKSVIAWRLPSKVVDINLEAFERGRGVLVL
ncbi:MAG: indolepyruvate oxidoreductase subunit beta [Dehalococcoidia bacterium]|nr:indolepyruvate oxidoreductase subunit beta [Dehalococcoidia bacterium]